MMKKLKKNGFTLVELLVTIILLGVIGAIVIYNMTSVSTSSKETEYDRFITSIKSAATVYSELNPDAFDELYINKSYIYIKVEDLVQEGLLDEELINPYTEEKVGLDELIKANLDSTNGAVIFEYPIVEQKEETFLVAISDYVVWGEPYNCMQGAGSYQLSLSDENGDLILLNPDTIKKYNFECKLPDSFEYYSNGSVSGMRTTTAGNYEVEYSWITESGTKKKATRILRVLGQVKPSFKTNYDYDFNNPTFFPTEYDTTTNTWKYLTYTPYIEGADMDTTTFKVEKALVGTENFKPVTNGYVKDYFVLPVDDGEKVYKITTEVVGHYNKNYKYTAEGKETIKTELVIPQSFITVPSTSEWATDRDYSIADGIHSPVGIVKFEFRLSNESALNKNIERVNANVFDKVIGGVTIKNVGVTNNSSCNGDLREFTNVYFRAINADGYTGAWTKYNAKMTNHLSKILNANSAGCTDSNSCCLKTSDGSCHYTNKVKYVSFGGVKFIVLENYNDGKILATLDGVSENSVIPTQIKRGNAKEVTCDLTVYKSFDYSSPVLDNIKDEGQELLKRLPMTYSNYLEINNWSASTAKVVEYTGTSTQWGDDSRGDPSKDKTYYKVEVDKSYTYSAYVGNVTTSMFTRYHAALYANRAYWTNDTYTSAFTVYLNEPRPHCNESTTAYNVYFYYISGANTIKQTYVGQSARVKPIVKFGKDIRICSGNGTSTSPYVIGYV